MSQVVVSQMVVAAGDESGHLVSAAVVTIPAPWAGATPAAPSGQPGYLV